MFRRSKAKEIRDLHKEIARLSSANAKSDEEKAQLRREIAKLKWEDSDTPVILVDASGAFFFQDTLLKLKGHIVFSWPVKRQMYNFYKRAVFVWRAIKEAIDAGVEGLEWIAELSLRERKKRKADIGRAVVGAIKEDKIQKLISLVRGKIRTRLEATAAEEGWSDVDFDRELHKQIRLMIGRNKRFMKTWLLVEEKFNTCEWRTVSSSERLHQEVLESREFFQVNNSSKKKENTDDDIVEMLEIEVEEKTLDEAIGTTDSIIIADALTLQQRFKKVVILAKDQDLRTAAEANDIKVASTLEEMEELQII